MYEQTAGKLQNLTYSKEQSPSWEAERFTASQEIPCILWNPNVHYRIRKCPPQVPTQNQATESSLVKYNQTWLTKIVQRHPHYFCLRFVYM